MCVVCVCVCGVSSVIRCNSNPLNLQCAGKKRQTKEGRKEGREEERKDSATCMMMMISG